MYGTWNQQEELKTEHAYLPLKSNSTKIFNCLMDLISKEKNLELMYGQS